MTIQCDVLICGAGIAGVSTAYQLAVKHGLKNILLVDERPPLTLTSDNSTECYRNWWPGPGDAMVALMNRSIDLMEELAAESGNVFHLNRRGYLYLTADSNKIPAMIETAKEISALGAGDLRIHKSFLTEPAYIPAQPEGCSQKLAGADLLLDQALIRKHFPYLSENVVAALHVRRAGWFSAQQLGIYLLEQARARAVRLVQAQVTGIRMNDGHLSAVILDNRDEIQTKYFVNAAGPFQKNIAEMFGVTLPVYAELHQKVAFRDTFGVVDRNAPLVIWNDEQSLNWASDEQELIAEDPELHWLLERMPAGVHSRPEGGADSPIILMLWEYHTKRLDPVWPITFDPQYPEIVLRGLISMLPGLRAYIGKSGRPRIDGGYYLKTLENRPIIGPMGPAGAYVIGGLSGFGLMAACAASELLAAHITQSSLPAYSQAFSLDRYQDSEYMRLIKNQENSGQL